ncbi:putative adhesin [Actinomadura pelletieri DSM 43383]|uniref:Putative adhesin n=1 Tax=Actinomadura pelletieri DSM 43383 TaxID=1120940 RepID=A0A495QHR6_9ACTN|nr:DUF4097 family beta strand repeat-containing protein [Actinomadura pelletieri]RKS71705.1 putative adhesin [Actinomadura pelletieri DSM 43383]
MSRWTIDEPTTLDFDGVVALRATLIAGNVSVLASDERPAVIIGAVEGPPLLVTHDAGMLTITHERVWEGVLSWLRTEPCSATVTVTVPHDCPVGLNLVSADAVVTGLTSRTSVKSVSGDVTLDGVTGAINANTVSGRIEAQGLDGAVSFVSITGDLSLAGGTVDRLTARTVGGRIAADAALSGDGLVEVTTVSGGVALRIPDSTDARVGLNSAAGRIETTFVELDEQESFVARGRSGTLGNGSARLTVNTVSGSITLIGRDDAAPDTTTPRRDK